MIGLLNAFKKKTIFDIARETGKKIAFIVFEDKIFITLAEKDVSGKIKLKVYKNYRWEDIELQIEPSQEFTIYTPKIEVKKIKNVFDFLLDRDYELQSPSDVIFRVEPYNVEGVIIVYPYEVLSKETLKLLGLKEEGVEEASAFEATEEGVKTVKKTVKVYSPEVFALDKQSIKMISVRSRISQIDTILTMLKDLIVKSESLMRAPFTIEGVKTLFARREFWVMVILIGALAILAFFLPKMMGMMGSIVKPPALIPANFTPTFP